jgi:hypoxia up-regulated 1
MSAANGVAVMSVDLGSEWMKVAIVSPGVPMEIVLNTDSQRKTPIIVSFRDGERLIGDSAQAVATRFPDKAFAYFLDLLAKHQNSSVVQLFHKRFPYHKIADTSNGMSTQAVCRYICD